MHLDAIFYPCLTYNFDEGLGDNHYNCPVVAYYPEVLAGNCPELEGQKFIYDYVGIHRPKDFVRKMAKEVLPKYFGGISEKEVQAAADAAYAEHEAHMAQIRVKGSEIIDEARRQGKRIIVLAGRPYHVDPEINHGIDHLITRYGAAVVTEDSISNRVEKFPHQCAEPVDLSQPPVCGGQVLHHPEGYGSGAAGLLWLRRGCHYHR